MEALVGLGIALGGAVGIVLLAVLVAAIRSLARSRRPQQVAPLPESKIVAEDGARYAHDPDAYREWFYSRATTQISSLAGGVRSDRAFVANMRAGHMVPDENLLHSLYEVQQGSLLGQGMDGQVVRVTRRSDALHLAMKSIRLPRRLEAAAAESLQREVDILRQLDHPNVIRLYDTFLTPSHLHIVMEVCSGGDLHTALSKQPTGRYREAEACTVMGKLLSAICYCHSESVVHRDVKLENVLLESNAPGADIKLIDFGLGAVHDTSGAKMTLVAGTPYYVSPEVLDGSYDRACDLWGAGVIAFMLLTGRPPFDGEDDGQILRAVRNGSYAFHPREQEALSDGAQDFVARLLVVEPSERLSAYDALQHPWIVQHRATAQAADQNMNLVASVLRQLKRFQRYPLFKRRVLTAIAHTLPREALDPVRRAFNAIDADMDGYINVAELRSACEAHLAAGEVEDIFEAIDVDGNGRLEYGEFLAAAVERRIYSQYLDQLDRAFDKLDVDGTGLVTAGNLGVVLGSEYSREKAEEMIADADANRDGRVARDEFHRMLLQSPRSRSPSAASYNPNANSAEVTAPSSPEDAAAPTRAPRSLENAQESPTHVSRAGPEGETSEDSASADGLPFVSLPAAGADAQAAPPLLKLRVAPPGPASLAAGAPAAGSPSSRPRGGSFGVATRTPTATAARPGGSFRVRPGSEAQYFAGGGPQGLQASSRSQAEESAPLSETGRTFAAHSYTAASALSWGPPMAALEQLAAAKSPSRSPTHSRSGARATSFASASRAGSPARPSPRSVGAGARGTEAPLGSGVLHFGTGFQQGGASPGGPSSPSRRRPRLSTRAMRYTAEVGASPVGSEAATTSPSGRRPSAGGQSSSGPRERSGSGPRERAGSGPTPRRRFSSSSRASRPSAPAGPPQPGVLHPSVRVVRSPAGSGGPSAPGSGGPSSSTGSAPLSRTPATSRRNSGATEVAERSLGAVPEEKSTSHDSGGRTNRADT